MAGLSQPLLSILVPAYCYRAGLQRIFQSMADVSFDNIELIIFDDSPDDEIEELVSIWSKKLQFSLRYQHNKPALGAPANWNYLLESARGQYSLLLHHDEVPLGDSFWESLVSLLEQDNLIDIILLDCVLFDSSSKVIRLHTSSLLRKYVVSHFPNYLYRRNVIGPVSTLVIRSSIYPRFDENIKWLVDVDLYARLFVSGQYNLKICDLEVGSITDRSDSITATIGSGIGAVTCAENAYLLKQGRNVFWGNNEFSILRWLIINFESLTWYSYRIITRITSYTFPHNERKVTRAVD